MDAETASTILLLLLLSPFLILGALAGLVGVYLVVVQLPLALVEAVRDVVQGPKDPPPGDWRFRDRD